MSAFLKNLPVKVLGGTDVYLSEAHSPPMTTSSPPPLTHWIRVYPVQFTYSHRKGEREGEPTRVKVREARLHKAGRKYQHD